MGRDRRVDQWSREAVASVEEFRGMVGAGVSVAVVFEQARYTDESFEQLIENMLLGAAVVAVVVFLMMGWRLGIIVGAALPIVIALTAFTLLLIGQSLHQMSVYGMVIALGLLIDNAIVMADEVTKRKVTGASALAAVKDAVDHLFLHCSPRPSRPCWRSRPSCCCPEAPATSSARSGRA